MPRRHDGLHPHQREPHAQWHDDEYLNAYPGARSQPGAEDYVGLEHNDARYQDGRRVERDGFERRNEGGESGWWTDQRANAREESAYSPSKSRVSHAGKGPKSFRRTDERIQEDVCERLWRHPQIDASGIEVEVKGGLVFLRGTVDERRTKRMAEAEIEFVPGVVDVQNELRIDRHGISNDAPAAAPDRH
jgi:hypothetical protein